MKLAGKIPVEQLDDERLTNIERRIVAGAGERVAAPVRVSAWRPFAYAGGMLALAGVAGVVGWKLHRAPVVDMVPDRVAIASSDRSSVIDIGDATIESAPNTAYVVTRPSGGVMIDLARGKVELEVGKRGARPPLVVHAGDTDVIVIGTHFVVDCGASCADGSPVVTVTEGVVKIVRKSDSVRLAAGHQWKRGGSPIALDAAALAAAGVVDCGGLPCSDAGGVVAADAKQGCGDGSTCTDGHCADGARCEGLVATGSAAFDTRPAPDMRDHVAAVPDARVGTTQPARTGSGAAIIGGPIGRPTTKTIDPATDPRGNVKALIRQETVAPPVAVGATDPATAVAQYREMLLVKDGAARSGETDSQAYYGITYMQHMRLGRDGDARLTIDAYLRRFSSGKRYPEYAAILWLKVRIECLREVGDACRQAAATYTREVADGPATNVARLIQE